MFTIILNVKTTTIMLTASAPVNVFGVLQSFANSAALYSKGPACNGLSLRLHDQQPFQHVHGTYSLKNIRHFKLYMELYNLRLKQKKFTTVNPRSRTSFIRRAPTFQIIWSISLPFFREGKKYSLIFVTVALMFFI